MFAGKGLQQRKLADQLKRHRHSGEVYRLTLCVKM